MDGGEPRGVLLPSATAQIGFARSRKRCGSASQITTRGLDRTRCNQTSWFSERVLYREGIASGSGVDPVAHGESGMLPGSSLPRGPCPVATRSYR